MPPFTPLYCHFIPLLAASLLAQAAPAAFGQAIIQTGNVTTLLGPTFFLDEATNGGVDTDLHQPNSAVLLHSFNGLLTPNQGPTRVSLTDFGFALHTSAAANDATSVALTFTYLGADEAIGGSDDVGLGTATGNLNFTSGGEYVFAFDTPLTENLNITGTRFRIAITPSNDTASVRRDCPRAMDAHVSVTAPDKAGIYRLHVWVKDGKGHAATANAPFKVH